MSMPGMKPIDEKAPSRPTIPPEIAEKQVQGYLNSRPAARSDTVDEYGRWTDPDLARANEEIDRQNLAMSSGSGSTPNTDVLTPAAEEKPPITETLTPAAEEKPPITETLTPEIQTAGYSGSKTPIEDVVQAGSEISKPDEKDTPNETKQKQRYKQTAKSILQAYFDEEIDKSTATYFMLNALSTLARNTGKDIGNIAAQFSGGTIDTSDKEKSLWETRQNEMFENEVSSEVENMVNTPAFRQMQHDLNSLTTEEQQIFSQAIDNYIKDAGKDLTVEGLQKQIELLGLNVDAARWAQLLHQPILNMVNSGKTSQQILGYILGTAIQAGPSLAQAGMTFLK